MRPENEARLRKIKRISGFLRAICKAFLAFYVLGFLVTMWWLVVCRDPTPGWGNHYFLWVGYNHVTYNAYDLTTGARVVLGVLGALTWGIVFKCVYHLHQLLNNYSRGEIFTKESARQIRHLGISCALWGAMTFAWRLLPSFMPVPYPKPGQSDLGLDLAMIGMFTIAISWFMEMAVEMREESELTV